MQLLDVNLLFEAWFFDPGLAHIILLHAIPFFVRPFAAQLCGTQPEWIMNSDKVQTLVASGKLAPSKHSKQKHWSAQVLNPNDLKKKFGKEFDEE